MTTSYFNNIRVLYRYDKRHTLFFKNKKINAIIYRKAEKLFEESGDVVKKCD